MTTATAPTPEEIRLTVYREWGRKRTDDYPGPGSLRGQLEDLALMVLGCEVFNELWDSDPSSVGDAPGRWEAIADDVVLPALTEATDTILRAMAEAAERYAGEFPHAPRARFVRVRAER